MLAKSESSSDHYRISNGYFDDRRWLDIRRHGVGMVAALLRRLVDQERAIDASCELLRAEVASVSVRIYAAGGFPGPTFLYAGGSGSHSGVRAIVHGPEVHALLWRRGPSPRRVTDCLEAVSRSGVDIDLLGHEASWRLLDLTRGRGLPDKHRLAFEAAWIAGQREFAVRRVLRPFLRSAEGKAWIAATPPRVLDEPLEKLVAMRDSLVRESASAITSPA